MKVSCYGHSSLWVSKLWMSRLRRLLTAERSGVCQECEHITQVPSLASGGVGRQPVILETMGVQFLPASSLALELIVPSQGLSSWKKKSLLFPLGCYWWRTCFLDPMFPYSDQVVSREWTGEVHMVVSPTLTKYPQCSRPHSAGGKTRAKERGTRQNQSEKVSMLEVEHWSFFLYYRKDDTQNDYILKP